MQLLNATEAKFQLNLQSNHLIILLGLGYSAEEETYKRLLNPKEWDTVRYLKLFNTHLQPSRALFKGAIPRKLCGYIDLGRQFLNRRAVDRIARDFGEVDALFLGNYLEEWELYMRHFPHVLKHKSLYLIDDGTDVLKINEERRRKPSVTDSRVNPRPSGAWPRIKRSLRRALIDWQVQEAEKVIFFTAYEFQVRPGDRIIKNSYSRLRQRTTENNQSGDIFFLGQCLSEDGYLTRQAYLSSLEKVKAQCENRPIVYLPHPRETESLLSEIRTRIKWPIKRLDVPVEWHLSRGGSWPSRIASFFCSALPNCAAIFGDKIKITAFRIQRRDFLKWPDFVDAVYDKFAAWRIEGSAIEVVQL